MSPTDPAGRRALLERRAPAYLDLAVANVRREYPHVSVLAMTEPGPVRSHRSRHPAFFGSFDWHSCVEMVWVAARLMRLMPGLAGETSAREALTELLTPENLAVELATFSEPGYAGFERPYGWGWYLTLVAELDAWDDPSAAEWSAAAAPLAEHFAGRLVNWLPVLQFPQRQGMHANTAFGLSLAWPWARRHSPELAAVISETARRLFEGDTDYPAHYEPSGADFLSGALTEATLMSLVLDPASFRSWLGRFLPGLAAGLPEEIFDPVAAIETADGQLAHLEGLNLSRAFGFRRLAETLGDADPAYPALAGAAARHCRASLDAAVGSDYMVEHWLAAYAVLLLT